MVKINAQCSLEKFRKFIIISSCHDFIPQEFLEKATVFPERLAELGTMYVEAKDKASLMKTDEVQFIQAEEVISVIYTSKSGLTKLRWERKIGTRGRVNGETSIHSIMNLVKAGVISEASLRRTEKGKSSSRE
ncbi:MAG: hypothetical protein ABIH76_08200 [Candidatus Bathyarchaeota archaeon]